ncbi:transposable element Tc1 transposase [Trichonephila clavipes]|nr:transposable element Tc1 transposase [Trichonephila clavipes]
MPRRRKGAKYEQISEFKRGSIVGLREAGLSYRAVAARVQRNSSTIMRVSKQWTDSSEIREWTKKCDVSSRWQTRFS